LDILALHPVNYIAGIINIAGATFLDDTQLERLTTPEGREYINRMTVLPTVEDFQSGAQDFVDACCRTLPYEVRERCLGKIMALPRGCMVRSITRKQRVETFEAVGKTMLPCLVIFGDRDELIVVDELQRQYKEWRNLTVEVVEGGSHVPWTKTQGDIAAVFNEKTLGWIDSVMRSWN
jgi:pimeloyl-ACP methyl ester carboxylesterase